MTLKPVRHETSSHPQFSLQDGKPFFQFIVLIFMSALRKKTRDTGPIEKYTTRELLLEMETLTKVCYSGKYGHILMEATKLQRHILEGLGLI